MKRYLATAKYGYANEYIPFTSLWAAKLYAKSTNKRVAQIINVTTGEIVFERNMVTGSIEIDVED
jgi:hypothetical protein